MNHPCLSSMPVIYASLPCQSSMPFWKIATVSRFWLCFSIEEVPNDDITTSLSVFVTGIAKLNNDVNGYVFSIILLSIICFIKYYFNHKDNGRYSKTYKIDYQSCKKKYLLIFGKILYKYLGPLLLE